MRRTAELLFMLAGLGLIAAGAPNDPGTRHGGDRVRNLKGPFTITAEYSEGGISGVMKFRGNVRMVSQDLEIRGDKLDLKQVAKGQYEANVAGSPAQMNHKGENGVPPVTARANEVRYDTRTSMVDLTGGAEIDRGTDVMTGDAIRYDVNRRHVSARGVNGGQVKITIQQPVERIRAGRAAKDQKDQKDKEKKP
jgi:lipopolysaccharide export system protein LptA